MNNTNGDVSTQRVRLLIVDDNSDLATALHVCFEGHARVESLGWVDDSSAIVSSIKERRPDVVLLDLTMPGLDPLEALRALRSEGTSVKFIAFSGYDDPGTVENAKRAGTDGFVAKTTEPAQILEVVERVHRGEECEVDRAAM